MDPTAVVFLGASIFRRHSPSSSYSFRRSRRDLEKYLKKPAPRGLGLRSGAFLDLFDARSTPTEQLDEIRGFAREFLEEHSGSPAGNLIIYYIGHGRVAKNQLSLMLAETDPRKLDATGLQITSLKDALNEAARLLRIFYLLDCRFSGDAHRGPVTGTMVARLAEEALAPAMQDDGSARLTSGSAVLGAAVPDQAEQDESEAGGSPFSDALLEVLARGDSSLQRPFTLADVYDLTWTQVCRKYPAEKTQPRLFLESPDQTAGDVARRITLFPNAAARIEPLPVPAQTHSDESSEPAPGSALSTPELVQAPEEHTSRAGQLALALEDNRQPATFTDQALLRTLELDGEIGRLREQLAGLRLTVDERGQRIVELDREIAQLKEQLEGQRHTAEERALRIAELTGEVGRQNGQLQAREDQALRPPGQEHPDRAHTMGPTDASGSSRPPRSARRTWVMIAAISIVALLLVVLWRVFKPA
jgi:hypothetical protein